MPLTWLNHHQYNNLVCYLSLCFSLFMYQEYHPAVYSVFICQALIYIRHPLPIYFVPFPYKTSVIFSLRTEFYVACGRYQTQTPLLASGSTLPKKVVLGIIFNFFLLLFNWLFPKCQPFPPNHFLNGCQLLKNKRWEGALNTPVTCRIPEARQDQASVPQTFSMEWQLCCLGHLLSTEKKKKKSTWIVPWHKEAKLSSTVRTENSILQNKKSLLENKTHGCRQVTQLGGELSSPTNWNYLYVRRAKAISCLVKETGARRNTKRKISEA